jgi:hypothetical protein
MAAYNALKYTQRLEETGFTRDQAEQLVKTVMETMDDTFATKADLKEQVFMLRSDMREMGIEIRSEMKEMGNEIRSEMKEMETSIRSDMQKMETRLSSDIQAVRHEVKELESRMTLKLGAIMLGGIALLQFLQK